MQVHHIGIMVSDIERSIGWYQRVLGLELVDRRQLGETLLAFLSTGNTQIELIQKGGSYAANGVVNHVAFAVEDLAAEMARLREAGVSFEERWPRQVWDGGQIAFFAGPDGETLELFQAGR
ncbi:MAG: VOC family protein [Bacillota bacterium]